MEEEKEDDGVTLGSNDTPVDASVVVVPPKAPVKVVTVGGPGTVSLAQPPVGPPGGLHPGNIHQGQNLGCQNPLGFCRIPPARPGDGWETFF